MSKFSDTDLIKDVRFGKIILNICKGYVEEIAKYNRELSQGALDEIYHNSLTYFFRLLFLLLAVSRKRFNWTVHLEPIVSKGLVILNKPPKSQNSYILWYDLSKIFNTVYESTNGVLFYSHGYSNLIDQVKIADRYLAPVLFYLKNIETESGIKFRDLNERFVGALYEQWLERALKMDNGDVIFNGDKKHRRTTGSYYTPEYIVDYIVRNTVGMKIKSIEKTVTRETFKDLKKIKESLSQLKILDPAMGSGHFLLNTANYLFQKLTGLSKKFNGLTENFQKEEFWKSFILENCIYGVDLNPLAVELTKFSFFLAGYNEEKSLSFYESKFKNGNSLIDNDIIDRHAFHWQKEFPVIFENDGFDCIIGNPPYGNLLKKEEKEYILYHYPEPKEKLGDNIVKPFISRAYQLLGEDGYISFIIPKSLVFVSNWQDSRRLLLEKLTLLEIADNGQCFSGVLLEMITFIAQKKTSNKRKIKVVTNYSPDQKKFLPLQKKINLPVKYFTKDRFIISVMNDQEIELFERINSISIPLIKIAEIYRGLSVNNKVLPIPDFINAEKILRGRHIERGRLRGFDYVEKKLIPDHFIGGDIVVQEIVAHIYTPKPHIKLISSLNPDRLSSVNTVTNLKLRPETPVSAEYVMAMLHTEVINWYIYRFIYINSFRTMHFSGKYAENVPIPILPRNLIDDITTLYRQYVDNFPDNKMYEDEIDDIFESYLLSLGKK